MIKGDRAQVKRMSVILCLSMLLVTISSGLCSAWFWDSKPKIVTTIYPLYEFTKQIVGDKAEVVLLTPAGVEPHDWEPSPADMVTIQNAKLFIYNGAGMEHWVDRIAGSTLAGKKVINASNFVSTIAAEFDEEGGPALSGEIDPHIWLDPVNAQAIVTAIAAALVEIDADNSGYYGSNAASYNNELAALHQEYLNALNSRSRNEIVTSHAAFGYLAKRYGLTQIAIMGLSPEAEPTPDRMAQIIQYVRSNGIKYIFFETLVSPKLSEIIASEAGAQTLLLNPLEGLTDEEVAQGRNYISEMRMNLVNLKYALGVID